MSWQIILGVLVLVQSSAIILTKLAADRISLKSVGIFYQYLFCLAIAFIFILFSGNVNLGLSVALVAGIGFINTFGNYFQWLSQEISLSKTALFFPLMEIVTIVLAVIFLKEGTLWNFQLIAGALLCFAAMWLFLLPKEKTTGQIETIANGIRHISLPTAINKKWFLSTLIMILIFGVAGFLVKLFSLQISKGTFILGWNIGTFMGSLLILALRREGPIRISKKDILLLLPLSLALVGSMVALFWIYQLKGQVSLVLPLRGLGITAIPVLAGWLFLKERERLSKMEKLGFLAGVAGAVLILLK